MENGMARNFSRRMSYNELGKLSYPELRKEYTKLRDIFSKRVKRLAATGSQKVTPYQEGGYSFFPKLVDFAESRGVVGKGVEIQKAALLRDVEDLTNLLGQRAGDYKITEYSFGLEGMRKKRKGQNAKILESLHDAGYEHISKTTLSSFGRFMDEMRRMYGKKNPNSEEQAEFFDSLKYNIKRRSTQYIVDMWREFERNGYELNNGNIDLFRFGD